ncbi:hypothetical protein IPJ72_03215 [Candidatus Peregrinibacteria bacterium]|nr:MAG: hypothetical protein IPJ72_03215 [Candidatus Peregrinibacteria bacterium]
MLPKKPLSLLIAFTLLIQILSPSLAWAQEELPSTEDGSYSGGLSLENADEETPILTDPKADPEEKPVMEEVIPEAQVPEEEAIKADEPAPEAAATAPEANAVNSVPSGIYDGHVTDVTNVPDPFSFTKNSRGTFEVGEFTGAATYSYSLDLPPGRNGMTPSVNFTYNSQNESVENIVGYQWNLNLYSIARVNKTGVENLYTNHVFRVQSPSESGELVALSTDPVTGYGTYGLMDESSFSQYEYLPTNQWVVTTKTGMKYTFGREQISRHFQSNDSSRVFAWFLSETRDSNDNFIRYTYRKESNQIYPDSIFYTGHGTIDGAVRLRFITSLVNRDDAHIDFSRGFEVRTNRVIDTIEVQVDSLVSASYQLSYTQLTPLIRNTLQRIDGILFNRDANPVRSSNLPPVQFEYTQSQVSWSPVSTNYLPTWKYMDCPTIGSLCPNQASSIWITREPMFEWDMNGDSLIDFEYINPFLSSPPYVHERATNNGDGTFTISPAQFYLFTPSTFFYNLPGYFDKLVDFDGDLRMDRLRSILTNNRDAFGQRIIQSEIYKNGTNGTPISNSLPIYFGKDNVFQWDAGSALGDINGDGLTDIAQFHYSQIDPNHTTDKICINHDGNSCQLSSLWSRPYTRLPNSTINVPLSLDVTIDSSHYQERMGTLFDCNMDGLADLHGRVFNASKGVYLNNGAGGWIYFAGPNMREQACASPEFYSIDLNGDGILDGVGGRDNNTGVNGGYSIGTGVLFRGAFVPTNPNSQIPAYASFPNTFGFSLQDGTTRLIDINGDMLPDIVRSYSDIQTINGRDARIENQATYLHTGSRPYFLKTVTNGEGGRINIEYSTSAQQRRADGSQANPSLPLNVTVVRSVSGNDGMGKVSTTNYRYEDGYYYYEDVYHREFAGFNKVTKTDQDGRETVSYYHQGQNSLDGTAEGEYQDHISKKGHPYRTEYYDENGNLLTSSVNQWEDFPLAGDRRHFVSLVRTTNTLYDPNGTNHHSTSQEFTYDLNSGNVLNQRNFGEVTANQDGSFSDIGNDRIDTVYTYATPTVSGSHLVGMVSSVERLDASNNRIDMTRLNYDGLAYGQVSVGNNTRQEAWLHTPGQADRWIATSTAYNGYGLPTSQTDPLNNTVTVIYDVNNLYPARITNALSQVTTHHYSLLHGQLLSMIDANGAQMVNTYDGLGRLVATDTTDPQNPTQLMRLTTVEYSPTILQPRYTDIYNYNLPNWVHVTTHHGNLPGASGAVDAETYVYTDGYGRTMQTKTEADNGQWITAGSIFNDRGEVEKSIQPLYSPFSFFQAYVSRPSGLVSYDNVPGYVDLPSNLEGTTYTYDALGRQLTATDSGVVTTAYDGWTQTMFDEANKRKDYDYDSRGNLIAVREYEGMNVYQTHYDYNLQNSLTQITDAEQNIRSFTYDSFGRRLTQTDPHQTGAGYGEWRYAYDDNSNLLTRTDAKAQVLGYTYDALNRLTQLRDVTDPQNPLSITTYTYDSCTNGISRVCSVSHQPTKTSVMTNLPTPIDTSYVYDLLGRVSSQTRMQDSKTFTMGYEYSRQGMVTAITYPYNQVVRYQFSSAGLSNGATFQNDTNPVETLAQNLTYSPLGQMETMTYGNGLTFTNSYDPTKRMRLERKLLQSPTTSTTLQDITYAYDEVGNITRLNDVTLMGVGKNVAYTYDDLHRLLSPQATDNGGTQLYDQTFTYSPIGNILSTSQNGTYTYSGRDVASDQYASPHAVTQVNGDELYYDPNGNLFKYSGHYSLEWNPLDQMVTSFNNNGDSLSYTYDETGRRASKYYHPNEQGVPPFIQVTGPGGLIQIIPNPAYKPDVLTLYPFKEIEVGNDRYIKHNLYLGSELLATLDFSSSTPTAGTLHFVHSDHLSGSNLITDPTGQVTQTLDYYPYGESRINQNSNASTYDQTHKFTGYEEDETGLYYAQARYYNGTLGRFVSVDPLVMSEAQFTNKTIESILKDPQQLNAYSYARNNPMRFVDRDGQSTDPVVTVIDYAGALFNLIQISGEGYSYLYATIVGDSEGQRQAVIAIDKNWEDFQVAGKAAVLDSGATAIIGVPALAGMNRIKDITVDYFNKLDSVKNAFSNAIAGGKHMGVIRGFYSQSISGLKKTIRSLNRRLAEHVSKINNPEKYFDDWDNFDDVRKAKEIKHWTDESVNFAEQGNIAKEVLKEKLEDEAKK